MLELIYMWGLQNLWLYVLSSVLSRVPADDRKGPGHKKGLSLPCYDDEVDFSHKYFYSEKGEKSSG